MFPFIPTLSSLLPSPPVCPTPTTVVIVILITIDIRHPPLCVAFPARLWDQRQGPRLISIWTSEEMWSRGVPRHRGTIVPMPSVLPYIYVSHPWLGHMRLLDVCSSKPPAEVVLKCMVRVGLPFFNWRVRPKWAQRATVTMENQVWRHHYPANLCPPMHTHSFIRIPI